MDLRGLSMFEFSSNLVRIRKERKISQSDLAKALGLTQQVVSGYEKGKCCPNLEVSMRIADYFGISLDTLAGHVVKDENENSLQSRMLFYFQGLTDVDKERCLMIMKTILTDRELGKKVRKSRKNENE